jgi:hypothetical protein
MKVYQKALVAAIALLLTPQLSIAKSKKAATDDADEIVKRADAGRIPTGRLSFTATVKDFENEEVAHETRYNVKNDGHAAGLVETAFPERQRGRKLLMEEDNLWLYTPDTKRPARVSMQQKLTGEIANGDLARTNFAGDYEATLIDSEEVKGQMAYHLKLKAKRSGVTYSKIEYWVSEDGYLPLKAVFFAVSGKKLKTAIYSEPKDVLGRTCMTKIHFTDALDKKKTSLLVYSNHKRSKSTNIAFNKEAFGD